MTVKMVNGYRFTLERDTETGPVEALENMGDVLEEMGVLGVAYPDWWPQYRGGGEVLWGDIDGAPDGPPIVTVHGYVQGDAVQVQYREGADSVEIYETVQRLVYNSFHVATMERPVMGGWEMVDAVGGVLVWYTEDETLDEVIRDHWSDEVARGHDVVIPRETWGEFERLVRGACTYAELRAATNALIREVG